MGRLDISVLLRGVSELDVCDARKIALGEQKRAFLRSVELSDVERSTKIGHEHAPARHIERLEALLAEGARRG